MSITGFPSNSGFEMGTSQVGGGSFLSHGLMSQAALFRLMHSVYQVTATLEECFQNFWNLPVKLKPFYINNKLDFENQSDAARESILMLDPMPPFIAPASLMNDTEYLTYSWQEEGVVSQQSSLGAATAEFFGDFDLTQPAELSAPFPDIPSLSGTPVETLSNPLGCFHCADNIAQELLNHALGSSPIGLINEPFSIYQMSPFEKELLQAFSNDILTLMTERLLVNKQILQTVSLPQLSWGYVVWLLQFPGKSRVGESLTDPTAGPAFGKFVLELPLNLIRPFPLRSQKHTEGFSEALVYDAMLPSRLMVGHTKLSLGDIQALQPGDLILLEDSHLKHWAYLEEGKRNAKGQVELAYRPFEIQYGHIPKMAATF